MSKLSVDIVKASPRGPAGFVHWPRSGHRRVLFAGCYLAFLCGLAWMGNRLYWNWKAGVPLTSAAEVWDGYFPELRTSGVLSADVRRDDRYLDVLILAGSTLETSWGNVEQLLQSDLQRELGSRFQVRVFNLAMIAHTSRDSYLKFSYIADKPFDVVLIYDGFNDCRMNNCPPGTFRDDYSHCYRYRSFEKRRRIGSMQLPQRMLELTNAIGLDSNTPNLVQYGADLKTPVPFRHNVEGILSLASQNNSLVVLQTFAYHIPTDYSDEKFKSGELDYSQVLEYRRCPLELWGLMPNVIKCVDAHNRVMRDLARSHPEQTVFVDQHRLIPHDGKHFVDPCHLTEAGCRTFVDNVLPAVVTRLRERMTDRGSQGLNSDE